MIGWIANDNKQYESRLEKAVLKLIEMNDMGEIIDEDFGAFIDENGDINLPCVIDTWDEEELRSHRYDWEKDLVGIYMGAPWFETHQDARIIPVAFCFRIVNNGQALAKVIHNYRWSKDNE